MCEYLEITNDIERAKKFFENQLAYELSPYALNEMLLSENGDINTFNLIDVRDYEDYIESHISFAQHMPYEAIEENLKIINNDKPTIVYCYNMTCERAKRAIMKLLAHNYPCLELKGGFQSWKEFNFETIKTDSII